MVSARRGGCKPVHGMDWEQIALGALLPAGAGNRHGQSGCFGVAGKLVRMA
jgi:hypothetical protein